jgi:hypothetical protein
MATHQQISAWRFACDPSPDRGEGVSLPACSRPGAPRWRDEGRWTTLGLSWKSCVALARSATSSVKVLRCRRFLPGLVHGPTPYPRSFHETGSSPNRPRAAERHWWGGAGVAHASPTVPTLTSNSASSSTTAISPSIFTTLPKRRASTVSAGTVTRMVVLPAARASRAAATSLSMIGGRLTDPEASSSALPRRTRAHAPCRGRVHQGTTSLPPGDAPTSSPTLGHGTASLVAPAAPSLATGLALSLTASRC